MIESTSSLALPSGDRNCQIVQTIVLKIVMCGVKRFIVLYRTMRLQ